MADSIEALYRRRLREERRAAGLTQAEFAELLSARLGVHLDATTVTRMETGPRGVRLDEAVAAAEALRLPLAALLRDEDSIGEQIGELQRELSVDEWRVSQLSAELQQARHSVTGTRRRIAELEAARRSQDVE
ncbi:helix-turn-helix domain-containing protein [Actinomycetota bacterium]